MTRTTRTTVPSDAAKAGELVVVAVYGPEAEYYLPVAQERYEQGQPFALGWVSLDDEVLGNALTLKRGLQEVHQHYVAKGWTPVNRWRVMEDTDLDARVRVYRKSATVKKAVPKRS